jgi:hypothetical protein
MMPALALLLILVCEVTWAATLPSPLRDWYTKWNWSLVPVRPEPAPVTVQLPLLRDWLPLSAGVPMSAQLQD